jgi:hypothetical protein
MILTGESPTVSSPSGKVRHAYKPLAKWCVDALVRTRPSASSSSGMAALSE